MALNIRLPLGTVYAWDVHVVYAQHVMCIHRMKCVYTGYSVYAWDVLHMYRMYMYCVCIRSRVLALMMTK